MILVVEDGREYGRLLQEALSGLGLPLASAGGCAEGVAKARGSRPGLVVADAALPDASGFELCRALRSSPETAGLKVLVVSGAYFPEEAALRSAGLGPDEVLPKPFRVADLHAAVRRLYPR